LFMLLFSTFFPQFPHRILFHVLSTHFPHFSHTTHTHIAGSAFFVE
jgi:hypothetical protein